MPKEGIPLQADMFTGELVDNRTDAQKKKDSERATPKQMEMFSASDVVHLATRRTSVYGEWLSQATPPPLALRIQDVRTLEEKERDTQREVEKLTVPLFTPAEANASSPTDQRESPARIPDPELVFDAGAQKILSVFVHDYALCRSRREFALAAISQ
jgi:hypothetical protein